MQRKYKITIHLKLYNIAAKNSICCQSKFRLVFLKMIFLEKNKNNYAKFSLIITKKIQFRKQVNTIIKMSGSP